MQEGVRIGLMLGISMVSSFLAGLMQCRRDSGIADKERIKEELP